MKVLQKQPKNTESQRKWDRFSHAMIAMWLSPYWVMLGAGTLGWGWSYWKSFLVESMVAFPLGCVIGSAMRWNRDNP